MIYLDVPVELASGLVLAKSREITRNSKPTFTRRTWATCIAAARSISSWRTSTTADRGSDPLHEPSRRFDPARPDQRRNLADCFGTCSKGPRDQSHLSVISVSSAARSPFRGADLDDVPGPSEREAGRLEQTCKELVFGRVFRGEGHVLLQRDPRPGQSFFIDPQFPPQLFGQLLQQDTQRTSRLGNRVSDWEPPRRTSPLTVPDGLRGVGLEPRRQEAIRS